MRYSEGCRRLALAAHLLLSAGLLAWNPGALGGLIAALLLPPLPGLWRGQPYTFAWASMLVTFYVGALLAEGYADRADRPLAFALAAVAAADFLSLVLFVRLRAAERRAAIAARTEPSDGAAP